MYQAFYNLTGKPFRLSPDPAFFFPSRGHKRALAYLRYGLNQDEGFVVITGAPGTGKTTLAKILLQEMDSSVVVAHLTTTQLEADDMLRMVAASFGLRYEGLDKAGLLKSLEHFLLARSRERKRALLVIDEAQNLPSRSLEELRMLSNLQVGDKALLQIFLLGQEQFRNMLDNPMLEQLRQRVIANYHLTPLAADECQRYVESRLHHVNWNNDPHFAEVAHELIHQFTDGIPRRINMLCDRILLFGCMEETHEVTGEVVSLVKKEMEEEVSGKSADESDLKVSEPDTAYKLNIAKEKQEPLSGSPNQALQKPFKQESRQREPLKQEPVKQDAIKQEQPAAATSGSESLGLTHESSVFAESELDDDFEFEELDIDYAMFEDKSVEQASGDSPLTNAVQASGKVKAKEKSINDAEVDSARKDQQREAKNAPLAKSEQIAPKKPTPYQESISGDKRVMGNTVQKRKPETVKSNPEEPGPSEISERDLFRVIPGGKSFSKIPGLGSTDNSTIAASANSEPSSGDVRLRRILRLVLAFHRSPSRFPGLDTPAQPLPEGITELLELAISDDQVLNQVSPAAVMGISPVMLRAAVRFFVRRALFAPEGDHFRTLGLHPGASLSQIEKHYDLLMRLLRQDKQRGSADSVEKVGQAYEALSRGEQIPNAASKTVLKNVKPVFQEEQNTDNGEENDSSDLIIDFEEVVKNPPKPAPSTFVAKPNERFNPAITGKVSRKTVRYASQLAVLGFGAVVIILGLYIVQLEPSGPADQNRPKVAAQGNTAHSQKPEQDSTLERQRGLLLGDGSTDSPSAQSPGNLTAAINAEAESTQSMGAQGASSGRDDVAAMPNESGAKNATIATMATIDEPTPNTDEPAPNRENLLASPLDIDPETITADSRDISASSQSNTPAPTNTKAESTVAATSNATANKPAIQPPTQFSGRDIEIADSKPRQTESFSSIAARTQTPKAVSPPAQPVTASAPPAVASQAASGETAQLAAVESLSTQDKSIKQSTVKIDENELLDLVDKFLADYEAGNLKDVMTLFASDARTNNRTNAQGIQSDYNELFKSTTARKMTISGLNWNIENDYARGIGDYRAQVDPVGTQGSQTFTGNITIQVQKDAGGLKISRFYFSNQSVSTGPRLKQGNSVPAAAVAAAKPPAQSSTSPAIDTKTEAVQSANLTGDDLQNLVSKFAKTYANADIEGMMSLFADNAKTNDQTSVSGIRKDYMDLFKSTTTRQMVIDNMKWTLAEQKATGEGPFEVKVKSKGSNSMTSVKGILKMKVEKHGDLAKIIELIHQIP